MFTNKFKFISCSVSNASRIIYLFVIENIKNSKSKKEKYLVHI